MFSSKTTQSSSFQTLNTIGSILGLLTHMEHMRMDPKHQFAAQYVLSRAAAERRERENLLGALSSASGSGLLGLAGMGTSKYLLRHQSFSSKILGHTLSLQFVSSKT